MDFESALKAGGASATFIAIIGIVVKLIQSFRGGRLHSECCGHHGTVGVNVEAMTPTKRPSLSMPAPAERANCVDSDGKEVIKTVEVVVEHK